MKGELIDEEVAVATEVSEITEEWEELSTPVEEEVEATSDRIEHHHTKTKGQLWKKNWPDLMQSGQEEQTLSSPKQ